MREVRIEKHLKNMVERCGGACLKWRCPGYNGAPDRIVFFPHGAVFFVELKAPKGKLRPTQVVFHNFMRTLGHEVLVLNTKDKVNAWIKAQASALLIALLGQKPRKKARITNLVVPTMYEAHPYGHSDSCNCEFCR